MKSIPFTLSRVKRLVNTNGIDYVFARPKNNDFGEPINEASEKINLKGVFHEVSRYISKDTQEGSQTLKKRDPYIFAIYGEAKALKINDYLFLEHITYRINEIRNVGNFDIVADISLEEVL